MPVHELVEMRPRDVIVVVLEMNIEMRLVFPLRSDHLVELVQIRVPLFFQLNRPVVSGR